MPGYILDTNHIGMAVTRASLVGRRLSEVRLTGACVGTCLPVLCEIEAGIRQVQNKSKYRRDLTHVLRQLRIWPLDLNTTRVYGDLYTELRRLGRVLSQVDMMGAALARQMNLTVATTDQDFDRVPGIRTVDWSLA